MSALVTRSPMSSRGTRSSTGAAVSCSPESSSPSAAAAAAARRPRVGAGGCSPDTWRGQGRDGKVGAGSHMEIQTHIWDKGREADEVLTVGSRLTLSELLFSLQSWLYFALYHGKARTAPQSMQKFQVASNIQRAQITKERIGRASDIIRMDDICTGTEQMTQLIM